MPHDMPRTRGIPVTMKGFIDISHAANKKTRKLHTGYILFINRAPIFWYVLLLILLDRLPCPDGMLIVWWLSSTQTEAKETLDSVPIELRFYTRPVVVAVLLVPMRPDPPPPVALR